MNKLTLNQNINVYGNAVITSVIMALLITTAVMINPRKSSAMQRLRIYQGKKLVIDKNVDKVFTDGESVYYNVGGKTYFKRGIAVVCQEEKIEVKQ
jgi:hypothetical protein